MRFMDEIISSMTMIKMYAWEKFIEKRVKNTRQMELNALRKMSYIRAFHMSTTLFITRAALFCTMSMMVLSNEAEQMTAAKMFMVSSYFSIVSNLISHKFPRGVAELTELTVAIKRLEQFLNRDEKKVEVNPNSSYRVFSASKNSPNEFHTEVRNIF